MDMVREGGKVDFAELLPLLRVEWPKEFGEQGDEAILEAMEKSHHGDSDVITCLVDGGRRIGWSRYARMRDEDGSVFAHVLDISILPERQGEGLGKLLMQDMIESARKDGYARLMSRSFESNPGSIALHRSMGFAEAFRTKDSIVWSIDL
jgi:L-amino acid N-acyltransferase YncA